MMRWGSESSARARRTEDWSDEREERSEERDDSATLTEES